MKILLKSPEQWAEEDSRYYHKLFPQFTISIEYEEDEDGNVVEVYYYYVLKVLPLNFNFANFPWVAVPRDSVDENYIFGGGNNTDHETI